MTLVVVSRLIRQPRVRRYRRLWLPAVLIAVAVAVSATPAFAQSDTKAKQSDVDRVLKLSVPRDLADFRIFEKQAVENVRRVMAATVGVRLGPAQASGVVVSKDGYVLTASHVSGDAGRRVQIIFPDGRTVSGETLGANFDVDGSLIRITEPGPWPYVPISKAGTPELGTWCMAIGHPGGVSKNRTPPVRLGRIIWADKYTIQSDCTISGGDSGGPLFDLYGNVIGIHSRIAPSLDINLHVPAKTYLDTWQTLQAGKMSRISPRSRFLAEFDTDQNGTIEKKEIKDKLYLGVYEKLAKLYHFDPNAPHTIDELRETVNLKLTPDRTTTPGKPGSFHESAVGKGTNWKEDLSTHGPTFLAGFKQATRNVGKSTVEIHSNNKLVALGTVIDSEGRLITKASELPRLKGRVRKLKCRLNNGTYTTAEFISENNQYDVALLRIDPKGTEPIELKDDNLQTGQWLVSVGRSGNPHCAGVVSVLGRTTDRVPGFMGVMCEQGNFGGALVRLAIEDLAGQKAGIRKGDLIKQVNDSLIMNFDALRNRIRQFNAGDQVKLAFVRDGQSMTLYMRLDKDPNTMTSPDELNGPVNRRAGGFPVVVQHDSKMNPAKCGGPVVDIAGNVVGINIARAERTASYMIPARRLRSIIDTLKTQ
jgi:S1-C subfamily serine protease